MESLIDQLENAKDQRKFWKKKIHEIEMKMAKEADGFPRLAWPANSYHGERIVVIVYGKFQPYPKYNPDYQWKCQKFNIQTRRSLGFVGGSEIHGWKVNSVRDEPNWLSEEDEVTICKEFPRSAWAKEILARISD